MAIGFLSTRCAIILWNNLSSTMKNINILLELFHFRRESYKNFERTMPITRDLLYLRPDDEIRRHKLKCLVQHTNSYFVDIKCSKCLTIKKSVYSHSTTIITCPGCSRILCISTAGKMKIEMEGCKFRRAKIG